MTGLLLVSPSTEPSLEMREITVDGRHFTPHPAAESDPDLWSSVDVDIDGANGVETEQLGSKEKFWVARTDDERAWLFKYARGSGPDTRGEDWAEWVVHKIAQVFGTPSAVILPARANHRRGILSRNVVNPQVGERLVHGNERLAERDPEYDSAARGENPRYTLNAVRGALKGVAMPQEMPEGTEMSGFDAFAGYLLLDALVAGRDRHHENWGVVRSGPNVRLAPSFDHGNALGFQESDERRLLLLADRERLARWLSRGQSRHFAGRPTLAHLALAALRCASPDARAYWRERLAITLDTQLSATVASVPEDVMSAGARSFAIAIVRENRRRLLDEYPA